MDWFTFKTQREPGFRFNLLDMIFIISISGLSFFLYRVFPVPGFILLPLYLGYTFFTFCNIVRIGGVLEAYWYVPFTLFAVYELSSLDFPGLWAGIAAVFEPLKILLVYVRIKSGKYNGVFYISLNRFFRIKKSGV